MTEYTVRQGGGGEGGTLPTLAAAVAIARPGDVFHVEPGVYAGGFRPSAGTTWLGQPGAVIDGGWNGRNLSAANDDAAGVLIRAAGVTVRGLEIRNVPGNGVAVGEGGHDFTLEDCEIHDCFHGGFKSNPTGETTRNVTIRRCHVHDIALSGRWRETPVNGCFLFKNTNGVLVEGCIVERGHGEGIAAGSRSSNVTFRRVTVRDTKHLLMYVANRARDVLVEECVLYQTGLPEFTQRDGDVGAGLVVGDEESGAKDDRWPHAENVTVRRCIVWNAGGMFSIRNNRKAGASGGQDGYNTTIRNLTVERCTFVTGPLSKNGIAIADNEYGAGRVAGRFTGNVFLFDRLRDGGVPFQSNAPGVVFEDNAFSVMPSGLAADNIHMSAAMLVAPFATPGDVDELIDALRPRAGSAIALGNLGALAAADDIEPPPPPPPPPPDPDEVIPVDWDRLIALVAAVGEQVAVTHLAAEAATDALGELLIKLDEYKQAA